MTPVKKFGTESDGKLRRSNLERQHVCVCYNWFLHLQAFSFLFAVCQLALAVFCNSFNRRMLMHLSIVLQKTLDSVMENLLQHLPYINVFSTGNLLKQKEPMCLIVSFR